MVGETIRCVRGELKGKTFFVARENLRRHQVMLKDLNSEDVYICEIDGCKEECILQNTINGMFLDLRTGSQVFVESDPIWNDIDKNYYVIVNMGSVGEVDFSYETFSERFIRLITFKFVKDTENDMVDTYVYPDIPILRAHSIEGFLSRIPKKFWNEPCIYAVGYIRHETIHISGIVEKGHLDW